MDRQRYGIQLFEFGIHLVSDYPRLRLTIMVWSSARYKFGLYCIVLEYSRLSKTALYGETL